MAAPKNEKGPDPPPKVTLKQVEESKKSKPLWIKAFAATNTERSQHHYVETYSTWREFEKVMDDHMGGPIVQASIWDMEDEQDDPMFTGMKPWACLLYLSRNGTFHEIIVNNIEKDTSHDAAIKAFARRTWMQCFTFESE